AEDRRPGAVEVPVRRAGRGVGDRRTDPGLGGASRAGRVGLSAPGGVRPRHAPAARHAAHGRRGRIRLPRRAAAPAAGLDAGAWRGVAVAPGAGAETAVAALPAAQPGLPDAVGGPEDAGVAGRAAGTVRPARPVRPSLGLVGRPRVRSVLVHGSPTRLRDHYG